MAKPTMNSTGIGSTPMISAVISATVSASATAVPARTPPPATRAIDCRGLAARDILPDLRGVRGELLVLRDGRPAPFGDLQQRLNRKTVDAKLMAAHPAGVLAYDLLAEDGEDLRSLPLRERRARLEALVTRGGGARLAARDHAQAGRLDAAGTGGAPS